MSDKPTDQPPTNTPAPRPTMPPVAGAAAVSELIQQQALAELVKQLLTASTSGYSVSLVQGGTTVTVHTASFPVLQHLTGYLHYTTGQAGWGTSGWQVTATVAPLPPLPPLPETLTGEYGEPATMAEIHPAGRLVHLKRTGSLLAIDPITQRLAICNPEPRGLFVDTYKAVRQLLTSASLTAGMTVLHASALTIAGQALVITGPAGAGKTTLLAAMLLEAGRAGALLGNDRILLDAAEADVTAHGWPTVTGLGYGTLTALPSLTSRLSRRLHDQAGGTASWLLDQPLLPERASDLIPAEVTADPTMPQARNEKIWLTPQELAVASGSTTGAAGRLALLVAPTLAPQDQTSEATRLLPAEAARLVRANLHHREAWQDHPNWLGLAWPTPGVRGVLRRLLESPSIPAVSLRVGRDPAAAARVVLDVLTGGQWPPPRGQDDA